MGIRLSLSIILLCFSLIGYSQDIKQSEQDKQESEVVESADSCKNELKFNMFAPIYSAVELSYERIFEGNTSLGVAASYYYELDNSKGLSFNLIWSLAPYYRIYFGGKRATGFFIEANANIAQTGSKDNANYRDQNGNSEWQDNTNGKFGYGMGFAAGAKFLSRKNLVGEVFAGIGRYFNAKGNMPIQYPRLGVTVGKRF